MIIYGLTGKTGAGKTTVAEMLKKLGFFVIDGDKVAREVTEKGSPVLAKLAEHFGNDILLEDGNLNRKLLAQRAFSSAESTLALNRITHCAIDNAFRLKIKEQSEKGKTKFVIDAAALLESPSKSLCSKIIVVDAPEEIRLKRILRRDEISYQQALTRIKAQKSDDYYLNQADIIIRNYPPYNIEDEVAASGDENLRKL